MTVIKFITILVESIEMVYVPGLWKVVWQCQPNCAYVLDGSLVSDDAVPNQAHGALPILYHRAGISASWKLWIWQKVFSSKDTFSDLKVQSEQLTLPHMQMVELGTFHEFLISLSFLGYSCLTSLLLTTEYCENTFQGVVSCSHCTADEERVRSRAVVNSGFKLCLYVICKHACRERRVIKFFNSPLWRRLGPVFQGLNCSQWTSPLEKSAIKSRAQRNRNFSERMYEGTGDVRQLDFPFQQLCRNPSYQNFEQLEVDILNTDPNWEFGQLGSFIPNWILQLTSHPTRQVALSNWTNFDHLSSLQVGRQKCCTRNFPFMELLNSNALTFVTSRNLSSKLANSNLLISSQSNDPPFFRSRPTRKMLNVCYLLTHLVMCIGMVLVLVLGAVPGVWVDAKPVPGNVLGAGPFLKSNISELFRTMIGPQANGTNPMQSKQEIHPLPVRGAVSLILQGYDCSLPGDLRDVSIHMNKDCKAFNISKVGPERNVKYTLLQREDYRRFVGFSCSMVHTKKAAYCGKYDHQTRLLSWSTQEEPQTVSVEECKRMVRERHYVDANGGKHDLEMNATNSFFYYEAGKDFVSTSGEGKCAGVTYTAPSGDILYRAVIGMYTKVTLEQVEFASSDEETMVISKNEKIPCEHFKAECITPAATYIWESAKSHQHCQYATVRKFEGIEYSFTDGAGLTRTIVKATKQDGSLLYLEKKAKILTCDRTIFATNYQDRLFLHDEAMSPPAFERAIHPQEMRWSLYISNRDSYLQSHISSEIEREVNRALYSLCRDRLQVEHSLQFLQRQMPDLRTHTVGNGEFAMAAGESLYLFRCRPVLINPVNVPHCYRELPVSFPHMDDEEPKILYLEPYTRQLKEIGVRTPCSSRFAPKFQTLDGAWIQALPTIMVANPPADADTLWEPVGPIDIDEIDFSQQGVYTPDDIEGMHRYLTFGQAREALGYRLAEQTPLTAYSNDIVLPTQLFPISSFKEMFGGFIAFLATWGNVASVFIATTMAFGLISKIATFLYHTLIIKKNYGCGRTLLWSCCPGLFLMRRYSHKRRRKIHQSRRIAMANRRMTPPTGAENLYAFDTSMGKENVETDTSGFSTSDDDVPRPSLGRRRVSWGDGKMRSISHVMKEALRNLYPWGQTDAMKKDEHTEDEFFAVWQREQIQKMLDQHQKGEHQRSLNVRPDQSIELQPIGTPSDGRHDNPHEVKKQTLSYSEEDCKEFAGSLAALGFESSTMKSRKENPFSTLDTDGSGRREKHRSRSNSGSRNQKKDRSGTLSRTHRNPTDDLPKIPAYGQKFQNDQSATGTTSRSNQGILIYPNATK